MAKMFYTLDEAAERLGVETDRVKEMVAAGQLQQFRDRDKLMFKRDQVDSLASGADKTAIEDSGGPIDLADSSAGTKMGSSGPIALADSGDTDAISLSDDTTAGRTASGYTAPGNTAQGTGISVFDAGEVEAADPMAQTQVTSQHADEDLALESVGSGSGLLDLTRESDDTSLGAELLDEIYPGGESADSKLESAVGSSGVFESALGETGGTAVHSGLTGLGAGATTAAVTDAPLVGSVPTYSDADSIDPAWNGAAAGALLAALLGLILSLVIIAGGIAGTTGGIIATLANIGGTGNYGTSSLILLAGLFVLALVFGGVGFLAGRSAR